jgi:hypothetical protein
MIILDTKVSNWFTLDIGLTLFTGFIRVSLSRYGESKNDIIGAGEDPAI